ncbi:sensor domain-containing diguanylate cyclase [Pseudoalteromonas piscicida]|uniref:Sensor domain-containing diguanylate cyclase n=1 Tax=Pseudoalteromonas piscicida TaxID=43662 RepID=A0AAQ2EU28_PSEO7|nr:MULTISPECIES: sensor domain-containing diguanylate cyclase [Pseudoalteromonas]KJY87155.1 diguanylate cyclase [Pseudoalteromonas piscicida]TMN34103.1 sensor domain-containing diguanylate cyclase [Pseudoalteromonas piscicida]TMN38470.1 sensor domain-containing diguanylate cyclase [Pseudoalteromonas piscicida]TMN46721.1 sensor domain-containing diguanylate cyclase [Pseudoalteromonas piscicida]TMN48950.1 sensor domain-containing diguanylate cyclase [Pseudoalteromonas piscicida]
MLQRLMIKDRRMARTQALAQPSYEELASTLSAMPDLMFELDEEGRHWDARILRPELLVAPAEQLIGHTVTEVMPEQAAKIVMQALQEAKINGYSHGSHIHLSTPVGERWFEVSIARKVVTASDNHAETRFIVLSRDINDRKLEYLEAEKLAYHDQLTELPNRHVLQHGLTEQLRIGQQLGSYSAVLFLDLDDFKKVNDLHGHHVGDQLLKAVAQRLCASVRQDDVVIRWGGDEFVILITHLSPQQPQAESHVVGICQQIINKVDKPYLFEGNKLSCRISIGVSLFNNLDIETGIQQADSAMYQAKQSDSVRYAFHNKPIKDVGT